MNDMKHGTSLYHLSAIPQSEVESHEHIIISDESLFRSFVDCKG